MRSIDRPGAEEAARAIAQQRAMAEISQLALKTQEPQQIMARVAALVGETLGADVVGVFELSADRKILRLRGHVGWSEQTVLFKAIPANVCRPLAAALTADGHVLFDLAELGTFALGEAVPGTGLAVPMGDSAARSGVLMVGSRDTGRVFDDSEASFLHTVSFIAAALWERRRYEAVLMLRNRALEAIEQGIMITDASRLDNPLIYVNPAFERLTGYAATEIIGKNPRLLQGTDTDWKAVRELRRSMEDGQSFRATIANYRKDGVQFWNDLTISPVRDATGAATHYVGIMSDVTQRVRLEAQLRQAQKMEAIGHLTGGIAHDFNNLLAVILGNSEILLEEIADLDTRGLVELIAETAERGAVLTQRLLSFGRRQSLKPEPLDIPRSLSSLEQMLQRTLGEQVELTLAASLSSCLAMVDRAMFESAILNLAVNARDAMPNGGDLEISACPVESPGPDVPPELASGRYVHISVRDTGTGMTPDVLAKAFEPFFTTKEVGRGSGLGLAMVYGFAKQSGGHVAITSAPRKGTTVSMYLPMAPERADTARVTRAERPSAVFMGSERILLVEDEAEVRRFVSRLLSRLGYSVIEAQDAQTAIEMLKGPMPVDLLFSDLILPGGTNGLKLVERARSMRPGLRILLTTGYTEEYERLAEASSSPILRKPYKRDELAMTLRHALETAEG